MSNSKPSLYELKTLTKKMNIYFALQEKEKAVSESQRRKMDLEETKRSLPIFPFRDDLIQAVENHQVVFRGILT